MSKNNQPENKALIKAAIAGDIDAMEAAIAAGSHYKVCIEDEWRDELGVQNEYHFHVTDMLIAGNHQAAFRWFLSKHQRDMSLMDNIVSSHRDNPNLEVFKQLVETQKQHNADLHASCLLGDIKGVQQALKAGASVWHKLQSFDYQDAMTLACVRPDADVSGTMVMNFTPHNLEEITPEVPELPEGCGIHNKPEIIKLLAPLRDVNARVTYGITRPIHEAFANGKDMDIIHTLLELGADIHATHYDGVRNVVHDAVAANFAEGVLFAAKQGVDMEILLENRQTPLMMAADNGHEEAMLACIECGVNLNVKSPHEKGNTALHLVADSYYLSKDPDKKVRMYNALVSAGADQTIQNDEGKTPEELLSKAEVEHILKQARQTPKPEETMRDLLQRNQTQKLANKFGTAKNATERINKRRDDQKKDEFRL